MKINYLADCYVTGVTITETPNFGRTNTGYGYKIPTQYMITYKNQKRRVYARCFSNVASHFVLFEKETFVLPPETLVRLEDAKDNI